MKTKLLIIIFFTSCISFAQSWQTVRTKPNVSFATTINTGANLNLAFTDATTNQPYAETYDGAIWTSYNNGNAISQEAIGRSMVLSNGDSRQNKLHLGYVTDAVTKMDWYESNSGGNFQLKNTSLTDLGNGNFIDAATYGLQLFINITGTLPSGFIYDARLGNKLINFNVLGGRWLDGNTAGEGTFTLPRLSTFYGSTITTEFDYKSYYKTFVYEKYADGTNQFGIITMNSNGTSSRQVFGREVVAANDYSRVSNITGETKFAAYDGTNNIARVSISQNGAATTTSGIFQHNVNASFHGFFKFEKYGDDYYLLYSDANDKLQIDKYTAVTSSWSTLTDPNITATSSNMYDMYYYNGELFIMHTDATDVLSIKKYDSTIAYVFDANAWSPADPSGVATSLETITILDTSNPAFLTANTSVNQLTISAGATLDLGNNRIDISGNVINDGTIQESGATIQLLGISNQILSGSGAASAFNCVINNAAGITLNSQLDVRGLLTLTTGTLNANDNLTLKSDANGTGQLNTLPVSGSGILGDVTVERFIPANRSFRFLSTAVSGQTLADSWQQNTHITGNGGTANGFDSTVSNNSSLFTYNNVSSPSGATGWQAIDNTTINMLSAGTAYRLFVRGDRTIDLNTSNAAATSTVLRSTGTILTGSYSPTLSSAPDNFNFIGNPYQAVVDYGAVTKTNLTDFIYVWDASLAGGNGVYVTVEVSTGGITAPSPSSSDATEYLAPGQAIFVRNTSTGNSSMTFNETDKAPTQAQVTVFSEYSNFYINSRLYKTADLQNGSRETDAISLQFNENFTTQGSDEDAAKLNNPKENYAIDNNGLRSMDKQGLPLDDHEIELLINNYETTAYSLSFNMANIPDYLNVYLEDRYLNTQTILNNAIIYDYTVDLNAQGSIASDRFKLIFKHNTLSNPDIKLADLKLYPNPAFDIIHIVVPKDSKLQEVRFYNLMGQDVKVSHQNKIDVSNLKVGVYLVEITTTEGQVTRRIIKQ